MQIIFGPALCSQRMLEHVYKNMYKMFTVTLFVMVKTGDNLSVHEPGDEYLVLGNPIKYLHKSENGCEKLDSIRMNKSPKHNFEIKNQTVDANFRGFHLGSFRGFYLALATMIALNYGSENQSRDFETF